LQANPQHRGADDHEATSRSAFFGLRVTRLKDSQLVERQLADAGSNSTSMLTLGTMPIFWPVNLGYRLYEKPPGTIYRQNLPVQATTTMKVATTTITSVILVARPRWQAHRLLRLTKTAGPCLR
jgi:hypothetical protein